MVVFGILFVLTMITSITTMIGLVILGAAWLYVIRASSEGHLQIASKYRGPTRDRRPITLSHMTLTVMLTTFRFVAGLKIPQKQATIAMATVSALVLFYLLSHIFWWTAGSGGFLVAMHAFFRDASMHQDQEDRVEMHGDLSLDENASFLNPVQEKTPMMNQV